MTPFLALFDVDGTLVDSQHAIVAAMTAGFAAEDLNPPPRAQILSIVGLSLPEAMAALRPDLPARRHAALAEAYKASFADARANGIERPPLYDGAAGLLQGLNAQDHILLGTATGKSRRGLDHMVRQHGLQGLFATLQCADDHPSKPHPSMVQTALAETGCDAARCVMIGDTEYDMAMARAAGVAAIGVTWGYHPEARLREAGAAAIVRDFAELERMIGAMT